MTLIIHPQTKPILSRALASSAGSYLLSGPVTCGRFYTVKALADQKGLTPSQLLVLQPAKSSISIAQVQDLRHQLQLKTAQADGRRVVIIRDADTMTTEAQNALLKTLEEPPANTLVILIAANLGQLLPTVLSRLKKIKFTPPSPAQIKSYLQKEFKLDKPNTDLITMLSGGCLGQAVTLASDPAALEQEQISWRTAETLLTKKGSLYQRLFESSQLAETIEPQQLLNRLIGQLRQKMRNAADSGNIKQLARYNRQLQQYLQLSRYLKANGNKKLVLNQIMFLT